MSFAPLFGYLGVALSLGLSSFGAAYGTWKSGEGVAEVASKQPHLSMRSMVPIVIAGVLAIYGIIVSVLISVKIPGATQDDTTYALTQGFAHLGAGLTCGLTCLAAGVAVGKIGQHALSSYALTVSASSPSRTEAGSGSGPEAPLLTAGSPGSPTNNTGRSVFVTMVLNLIYAEAIGLYGLIVALVIIAKV